MTSCIGIDKGFSCSKNIQSFYKNDKPLLYGWGLLFLSFCLLPFVKIEFFIFDYFFSKWATVYFAIFLFSTLLIFKNQLLLIPRIPANLTVILLALFFINLLNHLIFEVSVFSPAFFDRFIFIFLTTIVFTLFHKSLDPRFLIISITTTLFLFLLTCLPDLLKIIYNVGASRVHLEKNFGNINMSSEFVGISLAVLLASKKHFETVILKKFFEFLCYISIIYCYYASSRSVMIALFFVLSALFYIKEIHFKEIIKIIFIPLFIIFSAPFIANILTPDQVSPVLTPNYIKENSTAVRWEIIIETVKMIKDHPFGVGPGRFLFAFIPYLHTTFPNLHEGNILQSPHNEYLRFLAEDGIVFTLLLAALIISFLYQNAAILKEKIKKHPTVLSFFIFLAVQSLFQFPLINAVPFFLTACFTGYLLAIVYPQTISFKNSFVFLGLMIFTTLFSGALIASEVLAFLHPTSAQHSKIACTLNDSNYIACIRQAEAEMAQNDLDAARKTLNQELTKRPHNFLALSVLAKLEGIVGNSQKMCLHLERIDHYFNNQSSYHDFFQQNCRHFSAKIR